MKDTYPYMAAGGYGGAGFLRFKLSQLEATAERFAAEAELHRDTCRLLRSWPNPTRDRALDRIATEARQAADRTREAAEELRWNDAKAAALIAQERVLQARASVAGLGGYPFGR